MEKRIRFIYFDVANTLLYKPLLFEKIQNVLQQYGIKSDSKELQIRHKFLSEIIKFPDKTSIDFYLEFNKELLRLMGIIATGQLVRKIFEECSYLPWQAYDDFTFIQKIDLPKGIISNWDNNLTQRLVLLHPLSFDSVVGSMESGMAKPGSGLYNLAIRKSGVKPEQILYIGDSIKLDMEPAIETGMKAVLIDRLNVFQNYTGTRIKSFLELEDIIQGQKI